MPGRTPEQSYAGSTCSVPSMEGRAHARPNFTAGTRNLRLTSDLQWRAGHVPGQTTKYGTVRVVTSNLQWRAGHVPGQTSWCLRGCRRRPRTFNGGPGTCPAKLTKLAGSSPE